MARIARKNKGRTRWRLVALCGVAAALSVALLWLGLREDETPEDALIPSASGAKARPPRKARPTAGKLDEIRTPSVKKRAKKELVEPLPDMSADGSTNAGTVAEAEHPKRIEPVFRHGTEQLLALATPSDPGGYVPPLPEITDEGVAEDLARAMKDTIRPTTNDTERTLEMKLNVAQQKEEFRDLRKDGMTFVEYVSALREKFNEDAAFLAEARRLDESLFNDGTVSDKEYKAYRAELEKALRERGLPELEAR